MPTIFIAVQYPTGRAVHPPSSQRRTTLSKNRQSVQVGSTSRQKETCFERSCRKFGGSLSFTCSQLCCGYTCPIGRKCNRKCRCCDCKNRLPRLGRGHYGGHVRSCLSLGWGLLGSVWFPPNSQKFIMVRGEATLASAAAVRRRSAVRTPPSSCYLLLDDLRPSPGVQVPNTDGDGEVDMVKKNCGVYNAPRA